jgi:putative spermidine/putrescine transport system ATP-binding protein
MSDRIAVIDRGRFKQIGRPSDIYERPDSRFIAEFIGESSFLPVAVRGGAAWLGDRALKLARAPRESGAGHLLVLRPEKLQIVKDGDGADGSGESLNRLDGEVREIVYQGESSLLYVALPGGQQIAIRQAATGAAGPMPGVGAPVRLGLAPSDTILVPADAEP